MLKIRLQRTGKRNQPSFRVVLQEHSWAPSAKALEILGFYNPRLKQKSIKEERVKYWLSKGAQSSPTVHNLLIGEGIVRGEKVRAWRPKKKKQEEGKVKEKPTELASSQETEEAQGKMEEEGEGEKTDQAKSENQKEGQKENKEEADKEKQFVEDAAEEEDKK